MINRFQIGNMWNLSADMVGLAAHQTNHMAFPIHLNEFGSVSLVLCGFNDVTNAIGREMHDYQY